MLYLLVNKEKLDISGLIQGSVRGRIYNQKRFITYRLVNLDLSLLTFRYANRKAKFCFFERLDGLEINLLAVRQ